MNQLETRLTFQVCLEVLREQIAPLSFFVRHNIFKSKTSKVLGKVWDDGRFLLESSHDPFSKRLVGKLNSCGEHTSINYTWKCGWQYRLYGHSRFDEEEILSFLEEWLEARPVNGSSSDLRSV